MELTEYLPNALMLDIKKNAVTGTKEFTMKNDSTKLALCDHIKFENEVYKEGIKHLVNVIDDAGIEIEQKENELNLYKEKYGKPDQEFIKRNLAPVIKTKDYSHGKKLLNNYLHNYEKNKNNTKETK